MSVSQCHVILQDYSLPDSHTAYSKPSFSWSTSYLDFLFNLEPIKPKGMSRARNRPVEEVPATLLDLSPAKPLSDVRKLPILSKSAQARLITNLDTWLEAWSLYATVLTVAKPRLAPDLFRYWSFITRASRIFQPYAWLQYDSQFQFKLAANKPVS